MLFSNYNIYLIEGLLYSLNHRYLFNNEKVNCA